MLISFIFLFPVCIFHSFLSLWDELFYGHTLNRNFQTQFWNCIGRFDKYAAIHAKILPQEGLRSYDPTDGMCRGLLFQSDISLRLALLKCCGSVCISNGRDIVASCPFEQWFTGLSPRSSRKGPRDEISGCQFSIHWSSLGTGVLSHCTAFWHQSRTYGIQLD